MRVAGYQMPVGKDIAANARAIESAIGRAADQGAEFLLTPEGSLSGYCADFDVAAAAEALAGVTEAARVRGIGLLLGTCFVESDGACYNQVRVYDRDGAYLGFHAKILRCGSLADPPRGEIESFATKPLSTFVLSGVRIGALICNDLWANPACTPVADPHLSQQLAAQGSRVIFHAVFGGRDGGRWSREVYWPFHESNLRVRTRAAGTWMVTVDSCAPTDFPCSAPSGVLSPQGEWIHRARDQGEELFVSDIDLTQGS
jgi:predicted amidohydrolase